MLQKKDSPSIGITTPMGWVATAVFLLLIAMSVVFGWQQLVNNLEGPSGQEVTDRSDRIYVEDPDLDNLRKAANWQSSFGN